MVTSRHRRGQNNQHEHDPYIGFNRINGEHPFRQAVPAGYVDYAVRTRHGGSVFYFNFPLAKEMGLIPREHAETLNAALRRRLLDTFSIEIINEYDLLNDIKTPKKDIRQHKYMATRYLQAQHPDRKGLGSGDGRSVWNGIHVDKRGRHSTTWDISSCGTGATCLSPATAIEKRFFKTGDTEVSYGGGRCDLLDGVSAALMSEIFHRNNVVTERTLCVIAFEDGTSINVRATRNLLRPAHFFCYLKQGDYAGLKGAIDYYIERQVSNREWPAVAKKNRYAYLLERVATYFARAAARFESEYIFCWMDWDGDNILVDGGLIDFGSVRQFGLFHNEYRYDDVDRYSTTISEQKSKAKYIVQTFAQIKDYLESGVKRPIKDFSSDSAIGIFDDVFDRTRLELMLYKTGFTPEQGRSFMNVSRYRSLVREFQKTCFYFENAKSSAGPYEVQDGITWDAIFSLRDILRELPAYYLGEIIQSGKANDMPAEDFLQVMKSDYAVVADLHMSSGRRRKIRLFQQQYQALVKRQARLCGMSERQLYEQLADRSALINRYERVTGDSVIYVADNLIASLGRLSQNDIYRIMSSFIGEQVLLPEYFSADVAGRRRDLAEKSGKVLENIIKIVRECREGI